MAEFALFIADEFKEIRTLPDRPVNIPHKSVVWLPVVREYGTPGSVVEGDSYFIRTADPSKLPERVPASVTPRQARLALLAVGKLDAANAAVAASDDATKVAWEFASTIIRNDPGVVALAKVIGLDDAALDDLFKAADKL